MHPHRTAKFHKTLLRELTQQEINDFMNTNISGRLGTIGEDGPYIVPMSFVYYNQTVYMHCHHQGKKLDNIHADNRVCFQVDETTIDTLNYKSVIVFGKAERITDNQEAMESMEAMTKKYAAKGAEERPMPKTGIDLAKMIKVYKIVDVRITSKLSKTTNDN